jgi:hypothetical protein
MVFLSSFETSFCYQGFLLNLWGLIVTAYGIWICSFWTNVTDIIPFRALAVWGIHSLSSRCSTSFSASIQLSCETLLTFAPFFLSFSWWFWIFEIFCCCKLYSWISRTFYRAFKWIFLGLPPCVPKLIDLWLKFTGCAYYIVSL